MGGLTPMVRYRACPQQALKEQTFANFLVAHPVSDDSPLAIDLPNKEVMTIHTQTGWEMYFVDTSESPREKKWKNTRDNVGGTRDRVHYPDSDSYAFSLAKGCFNNTKKGNRNPQDKSPDRRSCLLSRQCLSSRMLQ